MRIKTVSSSATSGTLTPSTPRFPISRSTRIPLSRRSKNNRSAISAEKRRTRKARVVSFFRNRIKKKMKTLRELFAKIPNAQFAGTAPETCRPETLITDSRRVVPGALFFAMDGLRTNGRDFAEDAVRRGAIAVATRERLPLPKSVAQIIVPSVAEAVAVAAREFFDDPVNAFPLIGVTGTNGKTSVTSIVRFLMAKQTRAPWGLIGTVRYELGRRSIPSYKTTPESLDLMALFAEMRDANCAGAAMEVSSHAIDQKRVFALPFSVVAFTNLTQDHIDYHGDMENYFAVKSRLFDGSQGAFPRAAVINADDARGRELLKKLPPQTRAFPFGLNEKNTEAGDGFWAEKISLSSNGSEFTLNCPAGKLAVKTQLPGDYNVSNVLCALALVGAVGGDVRQAAANIAAFPGVPGRMERVPENPFPFDVFVDYAHTDDALSNALGMLKKITRGRVLAVFGCGGNRDREKRPKMVRAVQNFADFAWATSDNPRKEPVEQIFDDMKRGVIFPEKIAFEPDRRRAIGLALDAAREGDCVLIAGKGHETYQEFADITLPFDDKAVVQKLLALQTHRIA
ncbi:MAG: UDP-N-acetylmuramoyl-L-alanyl-D-glutamate--2,6-diaminopimelate ligase [Verrucomicrobia bacterium]|nr:UDP-N-acetylmuramoyl-L-alanyl-D-glutamate--2,6-diaminopimelate ligase [Verrucomicrobiota bacterium]